MARCEICGTEDEKSFEVIMAGTSQVFDSFECAIHALAPTCDHCGCKVLGHGIAANGAFYCCTHCAGEGGEKANPRPQKIRCVYKELISSGSGVTPLP